MPKTKFQNFIFTVIMLICMVYAMVCYNIAIDMGGMKNEIFIFALSELPVMLSLIHILPPLPPPQEALQALRH